MKKQLLSILVMAAVAVGIIAGVSSCKKEEVKPVTTGVTQQDPVDWVTKSGEWVKVEEGINIGGVICDKYQNKQTGQEVLVENYRLKKDTEFHCTRALVNEGFSNASSIYCAGSGNVCEQLTIGGTSVVVICQKKANKK